MPTRFERKKIYHEEIIYMGSMINGGFIDDVIDQLEGIKNRLMSQGLTDISLSVSTHRDWDDGDQLEFKAHGLRFETDEEYNKRIEESQRRSAAMREANKRKRERLNDEEYQQYLKLKEKFG